MPITVRELREYLVSCDGHEEVVIEATLADGTAIGVRELDVGFGQGGSDGEGIEVVIGWDSGSEITTSPTEAHVFVLAEDGAVQSFVSVDRSDAGITIALGLVGVPPTRVVVSDTDARTLANALLTAVDRS